MKVFFIVPVPESADHVPQDGGPSNDEYDDSEEVDVQKSATVHRVLVSWQPEVCIADTLGDGLSQTFSISTQVGHMGETVSFFSQQTG